MKILLVILLNIFTINAEEAIVPPKQKWSFNAPNGTFDRASLQRGFQVYKQVCAACHSIKYISFRHLKALGLTPGEIKVLAAEYQIKDGPNDEGEMFERPGRPSDYLPSPYTNEKQSRAANNGANPPDLSLIIKARKHGADYIFALLTGFKNAPAGFKLSETQFYNEYFPGHAVAMRPPLTEGIVTYNDGTKASVEQMAHDVTTFLSWTSEPELEQRKQIGFKTLMYLAVMTVLFYLTMRRVWGGLKH